jgi:hypothetical protein
MTVMTSTNVIVIGSEAAYVYCGRARVHVAVTEIIEWLEVEKLMPVTLIANVGVPTRVNVALSGIGGHPNDMAQ